jgi:hypothetical protein
MKSARAYVHAFMQENGRPCMSSAHTVECNRLHKYMGEAIKDAHFEAERICLKAGFTAATETLRLARPK